VNPERKKRGDINMDSIRGAKTIIAAIIIVIVIVAAVIGGYSFHSIGVGEIAVVYDYTSGQIEPLARKGPTYFFVLPTQGVIAFFVATQTVEMSTVFDRNGTVVSNGPYPALDVPSEEGLVLHMDLTVRWHLTTVDPSIMAQNFPGGTQDVIDKVVVPAIRNTVRDITGKHSALELYGPKRDVIALDIGNALEDKFATDPTIPGSVKLDALYMRNIFLPVEFRNSVENKQIAQQKLEQASFERETVLIQANATASAQIIQAQGIAESVNIISSQFRGMSSTDIQAYLTLKYIEALQNGFTKGNMVIVMIPGGATSSGTPLILQLPKNSTYVPP
jgi:regulator of protease activity HflC (stomatin/prohibitin superfamily)